MVAVLLVWQESALLRLAERQAGREEELAQAHQQARQAQARAQDLDQDVALLQQQVAALKEVRLLLPCIFPSCRWLTDSRGHLVTSRIALGKGSGSC